MEFNTHFFARPLIISSLFIGLAGCGSSGGSDDNKTAPPKLTAPITITSLRDQKTTFNEGEQVRLSLNTQNPDNSPITYNWTLNYSGGTINFSGQNTDTITFTAPQVDEQTAISVVVKMGVSGGTLVGRNDEYATILIADTDPTSNAKGLNAVTAQAFKNTPPQVNNIDYTNLPAKATWLVTDYRKKLISISEISEISEGDATAHMGERYITFSHKNTDDDHTQNLCGSSIELNITDALADEGTNVECPDGVITTKFYQDANDFAVKKYCDNDVIQASHYHKIANEHNKSLGELNIQFDNYDELTQTTDVCFIASRILITLAGYKDETWSEIFVSAPYKGQILLASFEMDDLASGIGFYSLSDFFDMDDDNALTLHSSSIPLLDGQRINEGNITLMNADTQGNLSANFDTYLKDDDGSTIESARGSFKLNLPQ